MSSDRFVRPMPHQFSALQELLAANQFDAVIADAFFLGILPLLLDRTADRPPILAYSSTPLFLSSADTAPAGPGVPPMPGALGRIRNRALTLLTRTVLLRPAHRAAARMLTAMGVPDEAADRTIRVSFGWSTTRAEVERFCEVWLEMARSAT